VRVFGIGDRYMALPAEYSTLPAHLVELAVVAGLTLAIGFTWRVISARRRDR
jgi:hypothetical protein